MKIAHYGELVSYYLNKPLIAYVEFGSYQGEYIAVLEDGDDILLYTGYYGSCSGCDWLEAKRNWETEEVPEEEIANFGQKEFAHSFASIPKETIARVDAETFISFLPANVRGEIYNFDGAKLHEAIKKGLSK